jgi:hypothetical protein
MEEERKDPVLTRESQRNGDNSGGNIDREYGQRYYQAINEDLFINGREEFVRYFFMYDDFMPLVREKTEDHQNKCCSPCHITSDNNNFNAVVHSIK